MKGTPDYYRGTLLYGTYEGYPKDIAVDSAGNMAAFLKAMFGTTPTNLQCDTDGNLKINLTVADSSITIAPDPTAGPIPVTPADAATSFKTTEQAPLSQIKVEPLAVGTIFKTTEQSPITTITVSPAAAETVFKTTEQSPLANIKVEPKEAGTIFKTTEQSPITTITVSPAAAETVFKTTEQSPISQIKVEPLAVGTIFKTTEQSPITTMTVEPKGGTANFPIDIKAQTLTPIVVMEKTSTGFGGYFNGTIANTNEVIIATQATPAILLSLYVKFYDHAYANSCSVRISVNNSAIINMQGEKLIELSNGTNAGALLNITKYDTVNNITVFALAYPIKCSTNFEIAVNSVFGAGPKYEARYSLLAL
jgi:hypothetical protein